MNSTFKVVFNKARGALMVVNEVTSSVQGKGTKTVVAAAVATMIAGVAGTTMAAEWQDAPKDLKPADTTVQWTDIKDQNSFVNTATTGNKKVPLSWMSVTDNKTFDKTLWVSGVGNMAQASGFGVAGKGVTFTNKGTIYVTSGKDGVNYQNDAIWAGNGATAINEGKIVAKDAYGMRVGTGDTASKIVNNGSIYVESTGAGMELGGAANSEAVNNGLISVGDVNTESKQALEFGHGVLIQDQTGAKFTNNGTITAGKGASAIEVKGNVNNTALNFGAKSDVNGLVHLAAGTTTLTFDATVDTMKIKTEQQKDKATVAAHLVLKNNASITLEDGQKSTYDTVTLDDSRLNASIWGADNTFKTVTVNEGSIFNITKLNSGGNKDDLASKPHDTLLISRGQDFTYDHAQMYVAGKVFTGNLKVGELDNNGYGTVTLKGGEHSFNKLTVGANNSAFNVNEGAVVTVGGLHLYHGKTNAGKVVVNGSTLINTGALTFEPIADKYTAAGTLMLENGTFQTAATDFFKKKDDAAAAEAATTPEYDATGNQAFLSGNGTLNLTSDAFEYSLANLKAAQDLIDSDRNIKVVFANGTLKPKEGEQLTADNISGLNLAGHTGVADKNGAFAVGKTTTVGAIDFNAVKDKAAKGITLDNAAALTLAGNGGDVFKNLGAKVTTVTTGDLVLGTAGNSGNVNVENLDANTLTVVGAFDAENVSFKADSSIKEGALLDVAKLTSEQNKMAVAGTLVADVIDANVTVDESGVLVLGERQLAPTKRALLAETPAAPEFVDQIQKVVTAKTPGALVTTNKQGQALFAAAAGDLFDAEKNVGLYVDHTIGVDDTTGKLLVGNVQNEKATGTVGIADNSVVVIDTKKFGAEDTVFDAKLSIASAAPVILSGLTTNTSFILATETDNATTPNIKLVDNTVFFNGKLTKAENGNLVLNTVFNDDVTDDAELNDVIKTQLDGSHNQKNADVLAAIADTTKKAGLVNKEGTTLTDKGVQAVEEYLVAPLTAGALNLAYDATAQVNAVVENRVLEKADGVWADVFYASNKDSERYGDFGYSADITGGTLGVDTTVSCGAKIGAAFTIGQGDADSEGTVHGYSTDADFYGISLYAGRNVADTSLRISGNLSYLMFENDIKGSVAGASADESLDGKAFTAGLRADWTAYEGAFTVAPHAGLRYTFLEMDDYRDLEIGDMNVVEMPFGVKVSGAFEPAAGWTLQPSVDFTVVPQLGDKDVDTVLGSVDVIDNLYNTELGVEAATGNFSFGLSYKYGFGKEDRKNQSLNLNARYMF